MILIISKSSEIVATAVAALSAVEDVESAGSTREGLRRAKKARAVVLDLLTEGDAPIDGDVFLGFPNLTIISRHEGRPIVIGPDRYPRNFTLARLKEAVAVAA